MLSFQTFGLSMRSTLGLVTAALVIVAIQGCEDAPSAADSTLADPYAVRMIDQSKVAATPEIPTFDQVLAGSGNGLGKLTHQHDVDDHGDTTVHHDPHHGDTSGHGDGHHPDSVHHVTHPDTTHHGGDTTIHRDPPAHDTTVHHNPSDTSHHGEGHPGGAEHWQELRMNHDLALFAPRSFRHAPAELGLSHEQDSLFRLAAAAQRASADSALHSYATARRSLFDTLNLRLHDIHDAMRSGALTHDQGRDSMGVLVQAYSDAVADLAAILRGRIDSANDALDQALRLFLTDNQYDSWIRLRG